LTNLSATLRAARHYSLAQLIHKVRYSSRRQIDDLLQRPLELRTARRDNAEFTPLRFVSSSNGIAAARREAKAFLDGRFSFAGEERPIGRPVKWKHADTTPLWQYHLHYLDFLLPLAYLSGAGDNQAQALAEESIESWLEAHSLTSGAPPWDPYPASVRLRNLVAWGAITASPRIRDRLVPAAVQHAFWIENRLEHHLRGNHLIKNYAVLAFTGLLLKSKHSSRWLDQGITGLLTEAKRQILPDGGHYERSPMYHLEVLEDYSLVQVVADKLKRPLPPVIRALIGRMTKWVLGTLSNDGEFPLFNDGAFGQIAPTKEILALAGASCGEGNIADLFGWRRQMFATSPGSIENLGTPKPSLMPPSASGLVVVRNERACLQFDVGPIGAPDQPGHAHSDTLSFELSLGKTRLIVDGGTSGYEGSVKRDYFRSTRAHNTVEVGGHSTDELWGTFRVGRVGQPRGAALEPLPNDGYRLLGTYRSPAGWIHKRVILFWPDDGMVISDEVSSRCPLRNPVIGRLHFSPSTQRLDSRRLRLGEHLISLILPDDHDWLSGAETPVEGWYAPRFGRPVPCPTVRWTLAGSSRLRQSKIALVWGKLSRVCDCAAS
jgi:uncharacterized heparinase superfamily protein